MDLKDIKKIFVVGAGTMGSGLSQAYAQAGYEVIMYSRSQQTLDKAIELTKSSLQTVGDAGLIDKKQIPAILKRIKTTTSVEEGCRDTDIAVETIVEKAEEKKKMFKLLDASLPERAIIASNTSFLNIYDFAETNRPDKVVIAHWYTPPQLIPLVEVVKGPQTSDAVVQLIADLLRKIGKKPAIMEKFIPGFIINRLQIGLQNEVHYLIDNDYIAPKELDEAAKYGLALRMLVVGILQRMDFGGIDVSVSNLNNPNTQTVPAGYRPKKIFELFNRGFYGVKTGRGWFDYSSKPQAEWNRERDMGLITLLKALNIK